MCNRLKTHCILCFEPATIPGPKPGDFPVGSLQSRAAARAILAGYAERQRMDENAELANLNPFEQAMSQDGETPLERIWLVRLARLAEERAKVYGLSLPTPEYLRHAQDVARVADQLAGGLLYEISWSNPAEAKRLRDLAEEELRKCSRK